MAGVSFDIEPLFETSKSGSGGLGAAASPGDGWAWYAARPRTGVGGANPWELAHELIGATGGSLGMDATAPLFVEPDLIQDWPYEGPGGGAAFAAHAEECKFNDQITKLPWVKDRFAWHLSDDFSQLGAAAASVGEMPIGKRIRIVHLDTGFDPKHSTCPRNLIPELQRNFVDKDRPNDATDKGVDGILKNPGHGTGTLSILAGNKFNFSQNGYGFDGFVGGAPFAGIVPVRVGNSVTQISTGSVARGINYAADLCASEATRIHVMSMSMGGVASQAWADAVNKAYELGIVYVAAAGNNFSALPTRFIVYPARFRRVIAACGVMANGAPYYGLGLGTMQGNWGPASKMETALSAFTPNMPWATIDCAQIVDMNGQGTSSATPQVAAAAALYLQRHASVLFDKTKYPEPWMRVEAVRKALFSSAKDPGVNRRDMLGKGILQANKALGVAPVAKEALRKTAEDSATFSFLRAITGLGIAGDDTRTRMLELEATQLAQNWNRTDIPNPLEAVLADPDAVKAGSAKERRAYMEAILEHPGASKQLRQHVEKALGRTSGNTVTRPAEAPMPTLPRAPFVVPEPPFRRLRGYAIDPSLDTRLETSPISQITFRVPWETLSAGPSGEYLEVIDADPASGCFYEPVNLDDPRLLAQDGIQPSEGTPQFHQQMVYAVASLTIENFERGLGRRTLWRPGPSPDPENPKNDSYFVQRLRIYPHALRERNAYYTPQKIALLFGYFRATEDQRSEHMPGSMVFTCLSHDIVAHETAHALLDGMNRCLLQPTNPDVHAFHEAFADIIALFQHFTFPEIVRHQITSTRGEIRSQENFLGELAGQFGRGMGLRGALRSAIGEIKEGKWVPHQPDPQEYEKTSEPHDRGAILVAAVFDAFLSIYERRTADLVRLASGGTGILMPGAIHPDLVKRLANEAAKSAGHVLNICIRALDYCPPTDITFGEFLRALITADYDLVEDDDLKYRIAFIEAFRRRGIYPGDVRTLSVESLLWRGPANDERRPSEKFQKDLIQLRNYAHENIYSDSREATFKLERKMRSAIHVGLKKHFRTHADGASDANYLGIDPSQSFEVRSARFANRTSPDGGMVPQLILVVLQAVDVPRDANDPDGPRMKFEGGATLVADLRKCRIRYCIRKNTRSTDRLARQQRFTSDERASARGVYFSDSVAQKQEPFAAIHCGC